MHAHVRMCPLRQHLILSSPKLFDPDANCQLFLTKELSELCNYLQIRAEQYDTGAALKETFCVLKHITRFKVFMNHDNRVVMSFLRS